MSIPRIIFLILAVGTPVVWLFYGRIDIAVIRWSHDIDLGWYRPLCAFITQFGVPTGWLIGSLLLGLYAHYKKHDRHLMLRARFFFAAVTISGLVVLPLKWLFGKARPSRLFREDLYGFDWFVSPTAYHFHSFPSGHTTTAFAVATALCLLYPRYGVLFFFGAVLVGLSRIGVLYHYPGDVVGGAMFGTIVTLLLYAWKPTTFRRD